MNVLLISTIIALGLSHIIAFGFGWLLAGENLRPLEPGDDETAFGDFPSVSELFHSPTIGTGAQRDHV